MRIMLWLLLAMSLREPSRGGLRTHRRARTSQRNAAARARRYNNGTL